MHRHKRLLADLSGAGGAAAPPRACGQERKGLTAMRLATLLVVALALPLPVAAQQAGHGPHGAHGAMPRSAQMNRDWSGRDPDVAAWAERFESPDREVIANRAQIVAAMGLRPGSVVADIGAGTGAFLKAISDIIGPGGHLFAVDISPAFVVYMSDRVASESLPNVSVVLSQIQDPTLPPAALDSVVTINTFHHFEAPEAMLAHIREALKPGGELVIVDFDLKPDQQRHRDVVALDRSGHVRLLEANGFRFTQDVAIPGLKENFVLRFVRR
jgi:SAM-dependent methyltransferase